MGEIVFDDVVCIGDEYLIVVCCYNGFGWDNCGYCEDVGVICCECKNLLNWI